MGRGAPTLSPAPGVCPTYSLRGAPLVGHSPTTSFILYIRVHVALVWITRRLETTLLISNQEDLSFWTIL